MLGLASYSHVYHLTSPYMTASFHFWEGSIKTSLIPPLFVEVHVPSQESEWSYRVCLCFYNFSLGFWNCSDSVEFSFFNLLYSIDLNHEKLCLFSNLLYCVRLLTNNTDELFILMLFGLM